jgi:hypothetical protein
VAWDIGATSPPRVARHTAKSTTFPSISGWVCSSTRRPSATSGMAMASSQYRAKGLSRQFEESVSVRGDVGPGGSATALRGTDVLCVGGARILETGFTAAGRPPPPWERPEDEAPRHPRQGAMFPEHNNDALMVNLARVDPGTVRRACCVTPCARVALQFPDWLTGPERACSKTSIRSGSTAATRRRRGPGLGTFRE